MARLRYNGQRGQTAGATLTSGGTTLTFAVAPNFTTLTGSDYIPLTLEPNTASMEIVYLTAYTSGATTGTISRAAEDATLHPAAAHLSGATWDHGPTIADFGASLTNPMTTAADIIVGDTGGAPARLGKGSDGQVLMVDPTTHLLGWATPSSGFADPLTTKGDVIVHGSSTTRLPVGSNTQVLTADSTQTLGVKWAAGVSAQEHNEVAAAVLVNATSTGDAGSRADHFSGSSLGGAWTQEADAPTSSAVANSVLGVNGGSGETHYLKPYTPSGALRVEARVNSLLNVGLWIRDSGTSKTSGDGILAMFADAAGNGKFYSFDSGAFNQQGTTNALNTPKGYIRLDRNGSNQWTMYISHDRTLWAVVGTANYSKTFTVAQVGVRFGTGGSIDFIDVVS